VKIAVVGLGNAATTLHLPALAGLDDVVVAGGYDLSAEQRQIAAQRFGIPVFHEFDALLESAKPDVVIVGTPPGSHADYCIRSLAAGAHVVCEKPFASNLEEADRIIAAASDAGRRVALNHEFREMPIFRALRDQVGSPGVGALRVVQTWQLMDLPPWAEKGWRADMPMRSFYEAGIHLLDYTMALFGEKPRSVSATISSCGVGEQDSDAVTFATLEFSNGRLGQVIQQRLCAGDTQYFEVRADCAEASLRASFGGRARLSAGLHRSTKPHVRFEYGVSGVAWSERGHGRTMFCRNPKEPAMVGTRLLLERTLSAFRDGTAVPASAQDGRDVLEVLAACYRSAETGNRIALGTDTTELMSLNMAE